jgi:Tfp pilus assembly protein FimT
MKVLRVWQNRMERPPAREDGFSLLQLIVVLAVTVTVSTVAVMSIQGARRSLRLANSGRQLADYLEKARGDSVRRRAQPGNESSVQQLDNNTYRVTMGFNGSPTLTSRDVDLESDVVFDSNPQTITFDWRGRPTTGVETTFLLRNGSGPLNIDVTGSGDVTISPEAFQDSDIPNTNLNANVSGDAVIDQPDPNASPTPSPSPGASPSPSPSPGASPSPSPSPGASPSPSPSPGASPSPSPSPGASPSPNPSPIICVPVISPPLISVHKNGGSAPVTITLTGGGSGTVLIESNPPNLTVTPAAQTIPAGGSATFTISSNDNSRGNFTVEFTTPCGFARVTVSVLN